jgi:DNA-binding NtrC family response regulator
MVITVRFPRLPGGSLDRAASLDLQCFSGLSPGRRPASKGAVMLTEQEKIETAVELLNKGAFDYIVKSKNIRDRLFTSLAHIKDKIGLQKQVSNLEAAVQKKYDFEKVIIGTSKPILEVFELLGKAASSKINVTLTGETGTGKELAAKAIHYNSNRAREAFVAVNLAALPAELIESELFGHEKGAFTGAQFQRIGKFEEATNGTIFLDEIAEIDAHIQVKLLRVLQEKEIVRIGSNKTIKVNPRIIVASHKDLQKEVKEGRFREDLYFRLFGLTIELPPLRDRGNDIVILAKHFIASYASENEVAAPELSHKAIDKLLSYSFPGNVRELRSIIELAVVMCDNKEISENDINFRNNMDLYTPPSEGLTLKAHTERIIRLYLDKHKGNVKAAARELDISYSTIYRMLKPDE